MKIRHGLALVAMLALAACSSDEEPTRRRSTAGTGDPTGETPNGPTAPTDQGVLILELSAASATQTVGQKVTLTAKAYLDAAKTEPVTAGTMISFSRAGIYGTLTPGQDDADATGTATTQLGSLAPGAVTVTASIGAVNSATVEVTFFAANTGGGGGGGVVVPPKVGGITLVPSTTSVLVNDDSPTNSSDSANLYATIVDEDGGVMVGQKVTLSADDGTLSQLTATTDSNGQIGPIKFTSSLVAHDVTITAKAGDVEASTVITVGPGAPVVIVVSDPAPAQIGVRASGAPESSSVTFEIRDKYGNPVSDNTVVTFTLSPVLTAATVSPITTTTHGGVVSPVVTSGTKSGTMRLIATVPSVGRSVTSSKITVFGGPPSADRFDLSSERLVMSGFEINGLTSQMSVVVTDRYGNPVVPGTAIYAACEAGRCGQNDQAGIPTDEAGHASFTFETAFADLVWISGGSTVVDFGGNVGTAHDYPTLGDPRDGYVKIIAMVTGESGYDDKNANGYYDAGDLLTTQMPEPYLDVNDDGAYNDGSATSFIEDFWDYNANSVWDNITGTYQARQYVWDSNTIIYNTSPTVFIAPDQFVDMNGDGIYNVWVDIAVVGGPAPADQPALLARFPNFPPTATLNTGFAGYVSGATRVAVTFNDWNDNPLPKGSVMGAFGVGEEIDVVAPPEDFLKYGAEYFRPLSPRRITAKDKDKKTIQDAYVDFCASVTLGDTETKYTDCIAVIVF